MAPLRLTHSASVLRLFVVAIASVSSGSLVLFVVARRLRVSYSAFTQAWECFCKTHLAAFSSLVARILSLCTPYSSLSSTPLSSRLLASHSSTIKHLQAVRVSLEEFHAVDYSSLSSALSSLSTSTTFQLYSAFPFSHFDSYSLLNQVSKEKDSLVSDTKAEIRALKGLLLSSRNFPAVKRTGGLVGSKPKSDDDIGSVASGNSFVNPLANPTEDRASALSSSPSGNTSLGPSRPVGTDDRGSALTNSTSGNTSLVNGNTGPSLASSRRISFPTDSALTSPSGNTSLGSSRRVSIPKDEKSGIPRIVSPHDSPTRKPSFQKDTDKDSSLLGQYFLESGSNTTKRKSVDSLLPVRSDRRFSKPSTLQVVNDVESKVESFDPLVQVPPGQPVDETPVPTDTDTALHGENIQEDSNVSLETPNHSSTALLDEDIQVASDVSSETPTFVPTFDNAIEPVSHDSGNFEIYKPTPNTDATSVVENISPDIEKHATTSDHTTAQPGTVEPSQVSKLNSDTVSSLSNSEAVDEPGDGDLEDVNEVSGSGSDKKKKKKNKKKKGK